MDETVISAYSEARAEYMRQLLMHVSPPYFNFFLKLFEQAKTLTEQEPKRRLWQFQSMLAEIPDWNMERVRSETDRLERECDCDYLEDLLTAVFIAYTKVLTAIRLNTKNKKVNITVPKIDHFLFKALCECSKILWQNTFLFREDVTNLVKQQNYREVEKLVNEGITQAVRSMTPVRSILKDCISDDADVIDTPDTNAPTTSIDDKITDINEHIPEIKETEEVLAPIQQEHEQDSTIKNITTGAVEVEDSKEIVEQKEEVVPTETEENNGLIDATIKEPSVKFTNINTIFTIDEPEKSDMQSVASADTDLDADADDANSLEFDDDDDISIGAENISDDLDNVIDEDILPEEEYESLG
jgi:hypothetical protein